MSPTANPDTGVFGETSVMVRCACPYCATEMDRATEVDTSQGPPKRGDVSVCIDCAAVVIFEGEGESLMMRRPSAEEIEEIAKRQPGIVRLIGAIRLHAQLRKERQH